MSENQKDEKVDIKKERDDLFVRLLTKVNENADLRKLLEKQQKQFADLEKSHALYLRLHTNTKNRLRETRQELTDLRVNVSDVLNTKDAKIARLERDLATMVEAFSSAITKLAEATESTEAFDLTDIEVTDFTEVTESVD